AFVEPLAPVLRAFLLEGDLEAGKQHRLGAKERLQLLEANARGIEIPRVGPGPHPRARGARRRGPGLLQLRGDLAALEGDLVHRAVARHAYLQALRKRVRDRDADAVQAPGERVGAAALLLELAA